VLALSEITFPQLNHPPLREALVDLRLSNPLPPEWLSKLEDADLDGFANPQVVKQGSFTFEMPKDQPSRATVASEHMWGRRYDRNDGAEVLQVTRLGMTLSILKDYTNWIALREKAKTSWEKYLQIAGPVHVSRLAVRYINGIEMPAGADYDEYLTSGPRIPSELPQTVNNFIQRVEIPFVKDGATAIVTQTLGTPIETNMGSAILDIDVFSNFHVEGVSAEIWSVLDRLNVVANNMFFSYITRKLIESYL
jgi:uncharacterized protein (TIGR04255 family)